jgi:cytochrome c-type biogenesis protein
VWTPCAGPVLASILTLIATRDSLVSGAVLLLVYAVGAAVPLLAIGWGGQAVTTRVNVFARHSRRLQQGFGAVMIAFAIATYFDYDALIAAWLSRFYPGGQIGL